MSMKTKKKVTKRIAPFNASVKQGKSIAQDPANITMDVVDLVCRIGVVRRRVEASGLWSEIDMAAALVEEALAFVSAQEPTEFVVSLLKRLTNQWMAKQRDEWRRQDQETRIR